MASPLEIRLPRRGFIQAAGIFAAGLVLPKIETTPAELEPKNRIEWEVVQIPQVLNAKPEDLNLLSEGSNSGSIIAKEGQGPSDFIIKALGFTGSSFTEPVEIVAGIPHYSNPGVIDSRDNAVVFLTFASVGENRGEGGAFKFAFQLGDTWPVHPATSETVSPISRAGVISVYQTNDKMFTAVPWDFLYYKGQILERTPFDLNPEHSINILIGEFEKSTGIWSENRVIEIQTSIEDPELTKAAFYGDHFYYIDGSVNHQSFGNLHFRAVTDGGISNDIFTLEKVSDYKAFADFIAAKTDNGWQYFVWEGNNLTKIIPKGEKIDEVEVVFEQKAGEETIYVVVGKTDGVRKNMIGTLDSPWVTSNVPDDLASLKALYQPREANQTNIMMIGENTEGQAILVKGQPIVEGTSSQ